MFPKLTAFLNIYFLSSVCGLKENIVFNIPELNETQLKWPQKKIETIEYLLSVLTEVGNVTLVGWQRIYDVDGSLKEIHTIELTILSEAHPEQSLDTEDVGVYQEVEVLEEAFNEASTLTGITWSGSFHQWDRDGPIKYLLEIQPNSIKIYEDTDYELMDWKRKATVNDLKSVKTLTEKLEEQSPFPVAVLHWVADKKLKVLSSNVDPMHIIKVASTADVSLAQLESAIVAVSKGITLSGNNIYKYVANYMTTKFPDYIWIVTSSLSGSWLSYNVFLRVDYETNILYTSTLNIYGYKK